MGFIKSMNLKEAKHNLEIVNLPINICNFDFHYFISWHYI